MSGKKPHNPKSDYQVVDGIYFYRENTGHHYYLGSVPQPDGTRKPMRLHRYIFEKHYGKLEKGVHIHHIDGDTSNNSIENLQILSPYTHASMHGKKRAETSRENMIKNVIPKAAKWHKSPQGRAMGKFNYENFTKDIWLSPVNKVCEVCGKEYTTTHNTKNKSRFCSNNCKSKFRRMSGVDNETRKCIFCGEEFTCNKYSRQRYCGSKCVANQQRIDRTGVPLPRKSNR